MRCSVAAYWSAATGVTDTWIESISMANKCSRKCQPLSDSQKSRVCRILIRIGFALPLFWFSYFPLPQIPISSFSNKDASCSKGLHRHQLLLFRAAQSRYYPKATACCCEEKAWAEREWKKSLASSDISAMADLSY